MIIINKHEGETMGQLLLRAQHENKIPESEKITFAGRLDPLASGVCVILVGDERFKKEKFLNKSKVYTVTYLCGVLTDTMDPLGIIKKVGDTSKIILNNIEIMEKLVGIHERPFPAFSSKVVDGKPLWLHTKEGTAVTSPLRMMEVINVSVGDQEFVCGLHIKNIWIDRIRKVSGDFRQSGIIESIKKNISDEMIFQRISITLTVTSGTYVRSLTALLEELYGVPFVAEHIQRVSIEGV